MKILIGSKYFFDKFEDFNPHDTDYIELVKNPIMFNHSMQISGNGLCYFKWRKMTPKQFINVTLRHNLPMEIGKFLVPEFNKEIGFTIEHLKKLSSLVDKLDERHLYEKIIYDAYMENGDFVLTDEQLLNAYNEYKKYR